MDPNLPDCPYCKAASWQVERILSTRTHHSYVCGSCSRSWRDEKSAEEKEADRVADRNRE